MQLTSLAWIFFADPITVRRWKLIVSQLVNSLLKKYFLSFKLYLKSVLWERRCHENFQSQSFLPLVR